VIVARSRRPSIRCTLSLTAAPSRAAIERIVLPRRVVAINVAHVAHHHAHQRAIRDKVIIHLRCMSPAIEPADNNAVIPIITQDLDEVVFRTRNVQFIAHSSMRTDVEQTSSRRTHATVQGRQTVARSPIKNARRRSFLRAFSIWWGKKDSNLRSHTAADLQSARMV